MREKIRKLEYQSKRSIIRIVSFQKKKNQKKIVKNHQQNDFLKFP